MMVAMNTLVVWNCGGDSLPQAQAEVDSLESLRSEQLDVVVAGRSLKWDGLGALLASLKTTIFHFIGHGTASGELEVNEGNGTVSRPIESVLEVVRAASPRLEGVYLSGCYTSTTGPEPLEVLAPTSGWVVGTTESVDDDVAALFAPKFYESLFASSMDARVAFNVATAYSKADFGVESPHAVWLTVSSLPPVDTMAQTVYTAVHGIFNRQAMQVPMRCEFSFDELNDAINDIAHALGTGEVLSRRSGLPIRAASFPVQWLHDPEMNEFVNLARRQVNKARRALAVLKGGATGSDRVFGNVLNFDDTKSSAEWMKQVNKVDHARNAIIAALNDLIRDSSVPELDPIEISFSRVEIGATSKT